ncbi:hypothetical protein VZT92_011259 [Zoarces viviparus]|uniref:Ig-like domain-containing protein n=1 Tax=Zoarces viviparus TaxID=48416 RepID=A0AAW1FB46_ZOAVI
MSELRRIKTFLSLILVLQFTAAATGQLILFVTVRDGDEVTLPCNSVKDDHENCNSTEWIFDAPTRTAAVLLFRNGKIREAAKDKSDRLSVSEKCSLVIKNVTDEDVGHYVCRQSRSGRQQGPDAQVYLSVVTMTEHEDDDEVTLRCSVTMYFGRCYHTVKWLLQGQDVDKDNKDFNTSQSSCSTSLTFLTSHFIYTSRFNSFKCEVTEGDKVQQFSFRNSLSGDDTTTETEDDTKAGWWRFIFVSVALAALIIIVVAVNIRARIKEKKTQMDQIAVRYDGEDDSVTYENIRPPDGV